MPIKKDKAFCSVVSQSLHDVKHSFSKCFINALYYTSWFFFLWPSEQQIDHEAFLELNDDIVKELIPTIGVRIKFLNKFRTYISINKAEIVVLDNLPVVSPSTSSTSTLTVQSDVEQFHDELKTKKLSPLKRASGTCYAFKGPELFKRACRVLQFRPTAVLKFNEYGKVCVKRF